MKVLICSKLDEFNLNISLFNLQQNFKPKITKIWKQEVKLKAKSWYPPHSQWSHWSFQAALTWGFKICIRMRPREPVKPGKNSVRPFFNISWHFSTGWHFGQITWHTLSEDIGADHGLQTHVCQSWIQVSHWQASRHNAMWSWVTGLQPFTQVSIRVQFKKVTTWVWCMSVTGPGGLGLARRSSKQEGLPPPHSEAGRGPPGLNIIPPQGRHKDPKRPLIWWEGTWVCLRTIHPDDHMKYPKAQDEQTNHWNLTLWQFFQSFIRITLKVEPMLWFRT